MKKLALAISILCCVGVNAETNKISVWQDIGQSSKSISSIISNKAEIKHRRLLLDESLLKSRLVNPKSDSFADKTISSKQTYSEISLPLPDGTSLDVVAIPSQVISKEMAESHPNLKTWNVTGIDNPDIKGVIDFTNHGFSGMLMMPDGDTIFIDPDKEQAGDVYKSFSKNENSHSFETALNCALHDDHDQHSHITGLSFASRADFGIKTGSRALSDSTFPNISATGTKTYRLALTGTAEYTDSQGGTAGARSSMVTSVNRINPIFNRDLGVSLELINAPELIFSNNSTDPFSNPSNPNTLMRENGDYVSDQGLLGNFDIGHVLSHSAGGGGSGVAFLGVACRNDVQTSNLGLLKGLKAAGATTSSNPTGSTFDLVLFAHELGHQLGANHSFNSNLGANCSSGRSGSVAVEPGSGSSIMAYAGLCGSDNLLENPRDDYFHFASISQVNSYTRAGAGASCGSTPSGGSLPTANAGADIRIPARTPFLLDGTGSGGTSSWDQIDIGSASAVDVDTGDNPIIRHIIPTSEQDRYIPSLANLFAGTSTKGEMLPTTTRELNFAYVVRNGGVRTDKKLVNVTNTNSQFRVISQDSGQTITTNQSMEVVWDPADTNVAPINCSNVDIQLIRANGTKNMLLASTPNDATQSFVVPSSTPSMSNARIFVGCSDNSFFNISSGSIIVQKGTASSDTTNPVITLRGVNPISVVEGSVYNDASATATDNVDGTVSVTTSGTVNTNTVGTYTITYTAVDAAGNSATATRRVNVTAAPEVDTIAPVITLNGASTVNIVAGTAYSDAGATATDNVDSSVSVTSSGTVNTNNVGVYTITYSATDAAGNTNTVKRTVNVTAAPTVPTPTVPTPTEPTPTEPTPTEPTPTEPAPTDPAPTDPAPTEPNQPGDFGQGPTPTNDLSGNDDTNSGGGGGGSFSYLLMPLMILLGLRRPKPVRVRTNQANNKK